MADTPLPLAWRHLTTDESSRLNPVFPEILNNLVRYEGGVMMPKEFIPVADQLYNFPVRDDDIWIVTFPKAGTTWTCEMVWMLVNDVDKEAGAVPLTLRSPYMEVGALMGPDIDAIPFPPELEQVNKDPLAFAENMVGRRVLKTHLPLEFLPPDVFTRCKVVYVGRNPRDVCVSYYKMMSTPEGGCVSDFPEFAELFKAGIQLYGDYWHHVLSGWNARGSDNVKFLWFEDMKKNQRKIIEELCDFLQHPLSEEQVETLVDHLKFDNMKANKNANPMPTNDNFFRKGEVGNWKNFFTAEKTAEWDKWIHDNTNGIAMPKDTT